MKGDYTGQRHPPFEPGHTLSLKHGARSPRVIAARAVEVHEDLIAHAPWLAEDHFLPAVARYLDAAATESLLMDHVRAVSEAQGVGKVPSRTWEQLTAARRLAAKLGADLGLDPIGHARLRAVAAQAEGAIQSLADLAAQGAAIRAARQASDHVSDHVASGGSLPIHDAIALPDEESER